MSPEPTPDTATDRAAGHGGYDATRKLVYMVNQIGTYFVSQGGDPAEGTATHLRQFWEPRMRAAIIAHLNAGGAGLDETARAAVTILREKK